MNIAKNRVVTIDYNLRDAAGKLIDSSEGSEPLVYLHGNENIIPGLEKHLDGKVAGDKVSCVIPASEGYGERDEQLIIKIDRKDFGPNAEIAPGMQFEAHGEEGVQIVTIIAVEGDSVTIDANHPLAGESLHFDVNVVDVREASDEELKHGHVHSSCGDDCDCDCDCNGEEGEEGCGCGGCAD